MVTLIRESAWTETLKKKKKITGGSASANEKAAATFPAPLKSTEGKGRSSVVMKLGFSERRCTVEPNV